MQPDTSPAAPAARCASSRCRRRPGTCRRRAAGGVTVVHRLLEQGHPGLLPEPVAEEGGELPATARTGPVASWAALKWAANWSGSTRRWTWKRCWPPQGRRRRRPPPVGRPRRSGPGTAPGAAAQPVVEGAVAGKRPTARPAGGPRAPAWAGSRPSPPGRRARRRPGARTIPRAWSSSLAMAANGRPASGAGVSSSWRLNRSRSRAPPGESAVSAQFWLRGRARPWASTRDSSSSAPTVAGPVPKPCRPSSRSSATRHSSSRSSNRGGSRPARTGRGGCQPHGLRVAQRRRLAGGTWVLVSSACQAGCNSPPRRPRRRHGQLLHGQRLAAAPDPAGETDDPVADLDLDRAQGQRSRSPLTWSRTSKRSSSSDRGTPSAGPSG